MVQPTEVINKTSRYFRDASHFRSMKHLITYFVILISFSSHSQRGYTYRPVQEETPPIQLYFGHIKSTHTTVNELLKVDSIVIFQPDIEEKYHLLSCKILIVKKNSRATIGGLNYVDKFDESFKSLFKKLKPGDKVSAVATVGCATAPTMKMGLSITIE